MKTRISVIVCMAVLMMGLMVGCGDTASGDFDKKLREMERLCMEERYEEAVAFADEYWFSHPCPIGDVVSGQNTFYQSLSKEEIRFRQRLAAYTRTALIGSGNLVSRFFSYYRILEIYSTLEDGIQEEYSLSGMLRQRALDNPTAVYCMGINLIEKEGISGEALSLMVPAMLACEQWNLAGKYIRVWAGMKGWKKEAARYAEVLAFLRASSEDSSSVAASDEVRALAEKITTYGKKGLTDYQDIDGNMEAECRERWAQNHASQSVLDCVLLYDLLYKDLEHVASLLPSYLQGRENVPLPLQEALLIMKIEGIPVDGFLQPSLPNFERFLQARALWRRGLKTPAELTAEFGFTFAYNYYFSRFVTPPPTTSHNYLMH